MKKRVGAIEEFEFLPLTEGKQLHITIAITGWLCAGKYGENKARKARGAWRGGLCSTPGTVCALVALCLVTKNDQFST